MATISHSMTPSPQYCSSDRTKCHTLSKRYLIYDQNFAEGFNLRRDVYIRIALLVNQLGEDWTLVLPEWSSLPHWTDRDTGEESMTEWQTYFNVNSLKQFVSVIEYNDFVHQMTISGKDIDVVISLSHFEDTFDEESNDWSDRHSMDECLESNHFQTFNDKIINLYENKRHLKYKRLVCLRIEGFVSTLKRIIDSEFVKEKTIFISNAEIILNDEFGSQTYWSARRSMRFSDQLISIANTFREQFLNSNDINDKTKQTDDWQQMRTTHGQAVGGQYLAVHLRRGDFAKYRPKDVPNIDCALKQIDWALKTFIPNNYLFIASDAKHSEWEVIDKYCSERHIRLFRVKANHLTDGQLAVVEQWVAVHAMVFIGTYDSTFSFRIQEEREILGFRSNTTFNALCSNCSHTISLCKQQSQWKVVF